MKHCVLTSISVKIKLKGHVSSVAILKFRSYHKQC